METPRSWSEIFEMEVREYRAFARILEDSFTKSERGTTLFKGLRCDRRQAIYVTICMTNVESWGAAAQLEQLRFDKELRKLGGWLKLVNLQPHIKKMFDASPDLCRFTQDVEEPELVDAAA